MVLATHDMAPPPTKRRNHLPTTHPQPTHHHTMTLQVELVGGPDDGTLYELDDGTLPYEIRIPHETSTHHKWIRLGRPNHHTITTTATYYRGKLNPNTTRRTFNYTPDKPL